MSSHGTRLVQGVRELIQADGSSLEDLHRVATEVVCSLEKLQTRLVKKLKAGQKLRVYNEEAARDYGTKGSYLLCFLTEVRDTKLSGKVLRVYDAKNTWSVGTDCLLEVFDEFDPESQEGKKRAARARPRRRGRKPKAAAAIAEEPVNSFEETAVAIIPEFEEELDGEEYNFSNTEEWKEFFPDE